jgi:hypothetical protein
MTENKLPAEFKAIFEDQFYKGCGCWLWQGAMNDRGYGVIHYGKKRYLASRVSYLLYVGEFDDSLCVLHKCDNPSCINPDHLFLGTRGDNNKDRTKKGRGRVAVGIRCSLSKLSEEDVKSIRQKSASGIGDKDLSKVFNTAPSNIYMIKTRRTWKHI